MPKSKNKFVKIEIVESGFAPAGPAMYINNHRVTNHQTKPLGGKVLYEFNIELDALEEAGFIPAK